MYCYHTTADPSESVTKEIKDSLEHRNPSSWSEHQQIGYSSLTSRPGCNNILKKNCARRLHEICLWKNRFTWGTSVGNMFQGYVRQVLKCEHHPPARYISSASLSKHNMVVFPQKRPGNTKQWWHCVHMLPRRVQLHTSTSRNYSVRTQKSELADIMTGDQANGVIEAMMTCYPAWYLIYQYLGQKPRTPVLEFTATK